MLILLGNQDNEQHLRGALEISVNGKKKKKRFSLTEEIHTSALSTKSDNLL